MNVKEIAKNVADVMNDVMGKINGEDAMQPNAPWEIEGQSPGSKFKINFF